MRRLLMPGLWDDVDTKSPVVTRPGRGDRPSGRDDGELPGTKTPPVAIAVNGRVVTTNRTWEARCRRPGPSG